MKKLLLGALCAISAACAAPDPGIYLEAESFISTGGWFLDNQAAAAMGSPYLLAHGLGSPVEDAETVFDAPGAGTYRLWVRTRDWTADWGRTESPGRFRVLVNGKPADAVFGTESARWHWQDGGTVELVQGANTVSLHDLTGFEGRCDAIYFTPLTDAPAPDDGFRPRESGAAERAGRYDLVVVGGGIAGCCAAVSAARLGCKVALIHNRPVPGGNNSSEIRVGLSGRIFQEPYPKLGRLMDELGGVGHWNRVEALEDPSSERSRAIMDILEAHPEKIIHNAGPRSNYEDDRKTRLLLAEENITLFLGMEAVSVRTACGRIRSVTARDIRTGRRILVKGRLFADCTGDGTLGFLAGADWRMGRESKAETGEKHAPGTADGLTMGTSVQWYSAERDSDIPFPECPWAIAFSDSTCIPITRGDWNWESGLGLDQIYDIEHIRDHGFRAVYGNWSYLKNHYSGKAGYSRMALEWVAAIGGKRESRRLLGDVILAEQDITGGREWEDATFTITWPLDLHYPRTLAGMEKEEPFLATNKAPKIKPYAVPFRCLYSRNIRNLMMAGRDISVTHVALGSVRVMRTGGMMGEVVGMAASVCRRHGCTPRQLYRRHFPELQALMTEGVPDASPR